MTQGFFATEEGFDLDGTVMLTGSAAPGGTTNTDAVGIGSYYSRVSGGNVKMYMKETAGSGTDKWKPLASEQYVLDNAGTSSWREPALAHESTTRADVTAAETAANVSDTVDGVTIAATDRILLSDLTSGNENVYIVSGSSGSWTFTEDTNLATDGDAVYIEDGTDAGRVYAYNGTAWVLINQASADELGFIRAFVGKTGAGNESPTYSSTNYATGNLEVAIGALDAQVGTNAGDIGTNATDISTLQSDLLEARTETVNNAVTSVTTVDSVVVDTVAMVKWIVYVFGNAEGDAEKKYAIEITAMHDGHSVGAGDDATDTDYTVYAKLKMGTITGLSIDVDVTGAAGAQVMNLKVTSTMSCNVLAIREVINF